jgi:ribosomal-protein-alanine N-acetyltransferase
MTSSCSTPNIPSFQTDRLILRELVESDAPSYSKYFINYEIVRNLAASVPWPYPADGVLNFFQSDILPFQGKDKWVWVITSHQEPEVVMGAIELIREATPANRGFWLGKEFWGKGYMTEAVEPINDYAFERLGFEKLIFSNAVGNKRSARIKEKTGARLVRTESASYVDPTLKERDIYELSKEQWKEFKSSKVKNHLSY